MKSIKDDLECINLRMVDTDTILTPEDEGILKEGLEEFETGKTISLSDLERDRGKGNRTPAISDSMPSYSEGYQSRSILSIYPKSRYSMTL